MSTIELSTTQQEFATARAQALRAMADHIEANPALAGEDYSSVRLKLWPENGNDFTDVVSALGGKRTKKAVGEYMEVTRDFGANVAIEVNCQRGLVCTAKVVGSETVEVTDPDAPKVTVTRPVIEWECSPILAEVES